MQTTDAVCRLHAVCHDVEPVSHLKHGPSDQFQMVLAAESDASTILQKLLLCQLLLTLEVKSKVTRRIIAISLPLN
jgi:hypothetical protein